MFEFPKGMDSGELGEGSSSLLELACKGLFLLPLPGV